MEAGKQKWISAAGSHHKTKAGGIGKVGGIPNSTYRVVSPRVGNFALAP